MSHPSAAATPDSPALSAESGAKRPWLLLVKGSVSAALLAWVLRGVELPEVARVVRSANVPLLLFAISLHVVGFSLSLQRWRVLLTAQGVRAPAGFLVRSYLIALLFNNLLPSTIGGDAVRAYDSWRLGGSKAGALAVIFVDRFLGCVALMAFALAALVVSRELLAVLSFSTLWLVLAAVGMLLVVWLIFFVSADAIERLTRVPRLRILRPLLRIAGKIHAAFGAFRGRKDALGRALVLSLLLQGNVVIYYYLLAKSLGFPIDLAVVCVVVPLSVAIMLLPVSINGIGLRETSFVFFFSLFGVAKPDIIALAWISYGVLLLQGLIGGVVYTVGGGGGRLPPR